jgi:anti-sigma factor RsiW
MDEHDDELSELIKAKAKRYQASAELRNLIKANLETARLADADVSAISGARPRSARRTLSTSWAQWMNLGLSFACGVAVSVLVVFFLRAGDEEERLAQGVVASHVRSLMAAHVVDVESSDKHTVKPWFTGKVDFSPPVKDFSAEGISLVGGRLDYIGQRPVVALVYRFERHTINVFIWPSTSESPKDPQFTVRQGFNVAHWKSGRMQFWAISDVNVGELQTLVGLLARAEKL